ARRGGASLCRVAGDLPRSRVRRGRDGRARGRRAGAGRREPRGPGRGGARPSARVPSRAGVLRAGATDPPHASGRGVPARGVGRSGSMSAASSAPVALTPAALPPAGRAALRAGGVGNFIVNVHVFLPVTALTSARLVLAGPAATASTAALIIVAMLFGRPVGGIVFGRISDRLGRTRTTRVAIAGTAACALAIAATPTHELLGGGTVALVLLLRFLCGIFVAGEYSAAIPLAMEWSPPRRRGLMSGLILSMAPWAQASIAFAVAVLLALLGPEHYAAWGWRALFVLGAVLSLGMLVYYGRHVVDAPMPPRRDTRRDAPRDPAPTSEGARSAPTLRSLVSGSWAPAFWQVFVLMTGLWLLTDTTVLLLTERLNQDSPLDPTAVPVVMGLASVAQALAMA